MRNDSQRSLTVKEAYQAMYRFLDRWFRMTMNDEVAVLLSAMSTLSDGMTADPAIWSDWVDAVEQATTGVVDVGVHVGDDGEGLLTVEEAYRAMCQFLASWFNGTKDDEVLSLLGSLSALPDGMTTDPAMWEKWVDAVRDAKSGEVDTALRFV